MGGHFVFLTVLRFDGQNIFLKERNKNNVAGCKLDVKGEQVANK
jgi:hypothetical protein